MQDLSIGILQFDQLWQQKAANYARITAQLKASPKLDLLLLPEMFHTGFSMDVGFADDWQASEGLQFLKELAGRYQMSIYTSLMVKDGGKYFNRGVFVYPDGAVLTYDKRKSFGLGGEDQYFSSGNNEVIVSYLGWNLNLQICYDLRFPELIRNRVNEAGAAAYDILLNIANWPQKRIRACNCSKSTCTFLVPFCTKLVLSYFRTNSGPVLNPNGWRPCNMAA